MKWAWLLLAAWPACAQSPDFVRIPDAGFRMARTETTVAQFAAFVKATGYRTSAEKEGDARTWKAPGFKVDPRQPVVYVSPADAMAYCAHVGGRLPADAEWEKAAAAGATTRHYWGEAVDGRYLWYRANSDGRPRAVAKKLPNAWGLHDVEGNAWEWALSPAERGEAMANRRGGSWIACEDIDGGPGRKPGRLIGITAYFKVAIKTNLRRDDIGFRCACDER
jgi:formylglycine-generating enzyme required for sulfatase activity